MKKELIEIATLQDVAEAVKAKAPARRKNFLRLSEKLKPIMSAAIEAEIEAVLSQYEDQAKWKEWGMDTLRKQGAAILMGGPPGTGKTTIAMYLSKRVGRGFASLNMKDVGGKAPGQTERTISEFFQRADINGKQTIFLDECEAILWDRKRAGSDSMWMVGVIDELLMQIAKYKGLVILATNQIETVDSALLDRCFAVLQIGRPEQPERMRLWEQKIPERFPLQLTHIQRESLSVFNLSGRQIENAIVREASKALAEKRNPSFQTLLQEVKALAQQ